MTTSDTPPGDPANLPSNQIVQETSVDDAAAIFSDQRMSIGAAGAAARAKYEVQAAAVLALTNPRNEIAAFGRVMEACGRVGFAENAVYAIPRGKEKDPVSGEWKDAFVEGPSVHLAREFARAWGNVRFGIDVIELSAADVHIRGWAWDMQTNSYCQAESRFARKVYRKNGGLMDPTENQLREMINKHGAICVRNAILQLLPSDFVDAAVAKANATWAAKTATSPREAMIRMVEQFASAGVTAAMLQLFTGVDDLTRAPNEKLAELRKILTAITAGTGKVHEFFDLKAEQTLADQKRTAAEGKKGAK